MTNETIRNVPRELLERASNLAFQTQHYPLHEELRAILSVPLPADHVEDVRAMVKAQGVVMPEGWIPLTIEHEPGYPEDVAFGPKRMMDRLKKWLDRYFEMRLNAAPVQQVSVPASAFASRAITHYEAALLAAFPSGSSGEVFNQWNEARRVLAAAPAVPSQGEQVRVVPVEPTEAMRKAAQDKLASEGLIVTDWLIHTAYSAMLAAAPAAPAADAGIVDMYRHLQKVTPYRFKKIQDASITDGGDVMYFHKDRFDAALLADMATRCAAKGVM